MAKPQGVKERLSGIRAFLRGRIKPLKTPSPAVTLFFSVSDGDRRARVVNVSGLSLEAAWQKGMPLLLAAMKADGIEGRWIRVDWIEVAEATTWPRLRALLEKVKRNYFRFGIALDPEFRFAFTEQELNANAMLYGGNTISHAVLNEKNFSLYAQARHDDLPPLRFSDEERIHLFQTKGVFCDEAGRLYPLDGTGLDAGRRTIERLDGGIVLSLLRDSSVYLARQVNDDGAFIYGYHACFDRRIEAYNALRHASTTYAMIEAWEVTHDTRLKAAIERALGYLAETLIKPAILPDGTEAAFLVEADNEIKLGGNAVAILALVKYMKVTGQDAWRALADRLAFGIRHMQDRQTGAFVHVLHFPDLTVKQNYRTIYYDGEAAFGLMRLYDLTGEALWLSTVEKAFDHFIAKDHWKHHDHWLGYCVNELTRHKPEERYFRFAIRNIADYLDFVENRITTFPTLLELMMAVRQTLSRIAADPRLHRLLDEIDLVHFERALERRAHHLLNGHFWPEMAMYCRRPDRIAGSFFIRHHAFRVRIDDVEHYLSGFVAYRSYLRERAAFRDLVRRYAAPRRPSNQAPSGPKALPPETTWTAAHVEAATGGRWMRRPPEGWTANGVCIFAPAMQPEALVVVRTADGDTGIPIHAVGGLQRPAGLITTEPALTGAYEGPVLQVADGMRAVLSLGEYARDHMAGNVLGVTGSAGKTTVVAMLAHALSAWGPVGKSHHNANLPAGVAWNLASIPWDTPHVVLELAIGKMAISARMARPKVAVFTNILPAHLGETSTVLDIARTKSAIFLGMAAGDTAVLNRDMLEWDTVHDAARRRGLDILTYGASDDCAFRLLRYDAVNGRAYARIKGREMSYCVGAAGRHMALNGLAVLAAVSALGHPLDPAIALLESFSALPGRGEEIRLSLDGRWLTVIDDAYNANPGSMRAALDRLNDHGGGGRRIAVLGEMAELGPGSAAYHTELAALLRASSIDRVYAVGDLYADFWSALSPPLRGAHVGSRQALKDILRERLEDGDVVLFKGSHSAGMHELVAWLKKSADGSAAA
ncbi:Mur ligase family protein [Agrobacterium sp. NPDC089420]|uniref:Mur ligase family protein n=1 Tax=Agrobacterium sp. NPDC089420 TaxID=3363918 RepID=UPI00384EE510